MKMKTLALLTSLASVAVLPFAMASGATPPVTIAQPDNPAAQAAAGLVNRVLPGHASDFIVEIISQENGKDVFEIEPKDGKIALRGNDGVVVAVAFNWYLRYTAKINFDWLAVGPLQIKGDLPLPAGKTRQACAAKERFFLNYCTYSYTMPWWKWDQWQRFIDWMAMNGINRPLMQVGLEAVWLEVWKSYGLTDAQIRAYFGAPAHLAFHRMACHDGWDHPLPTSYLEGQKELQPKILAQARALGMKTILSGFAGHVPEALKTVKPDIKISQLAWGMKPENSSWFLSPSDPLFTEIQVKFLKKQAEMYGTDHLYAADPFNEMKPPSWEPAYLASVSKGIYDGMVAGDKDAVWYQMAWTFLWDKEWKDNHARLEAMTKAVPQGKMVFLDYLGEERGREFYRASRNCYGAPFIWCYLGNFGGHTHLVAPIRSTSANLADALAVPNCIGVGSTLEGLTVNPIIYDLVLEQPWHPQAKVDLNTWVADYSTHRAGRADPAVLAAWETLSKKVLVNGASTIWGHGVMLQCKPGEGTGWTDPTIPYKNPDLVAALEQMLKADPACRKADGYQFDLVNLTRQAIGNQSTIVHVRMMKAVQDKNLAAFRKESALFLEMGRDIDTLMATRHELLLGAWIADARKWGLSSTEQAFYEHNARQILSTWREPGNEHNGGTLTDYASRQWNGMMKSYYMPRWEEYIKRQDESLVQSKPFNQSAYAQWRIKFEADWVDQSGENFLTKPEGDACETAKRLFEKYRKELMPLSVSPSVPH